jgi:peptide/nickel transport system permease protein
MARFLLGRLLDGLVAILGVVTIVFVVSRLLGDPAVLLLPVGATEAQLQELRAGLGLDRPIWEQYLSYLAGAVRGDFGQSFQFMRPAIEVVLERMPATMALAFSALGIGIVFGAVAGSLAALYRGTVIEGAVMVLALLGQATPVFWLGLLLILLFAVELGLLPTGGYDGPASLVLPALTLGTFTTASIARLLRSGMLDVMRDDHVRTARAKGLTPGRVRRSHVVRNAMIPVTTVLGLQMGTLLGGTVLVEYVFNWPGLSTPLLRAVEGRDYPMVVGIVLVVSGLFLLINLLMDLLYAVLDPRISRG